MLFHFYFYGLAGHSVLLVLFFLWVFHSKQCREFCVVFYPSSGVSGNISLRRITCSSQIRTSSSELSLPRSVVILLLPNKVATDSSMTAVVLLRGKPSKKTTAGGNVDWKVSFIKSRKKIANLPIIIIRKFDFLNAHSHGYYGLIN